MSPCRSLTGLSCTAQIATAANKLKDDLARCELNLKAELGECQTQNEIEGLALQSWLQNIETRIQGAAVGVMGRLASLESAHEASKHETREMCEAVGTACVERALQVADSKFSDLEQDMNEICEENVTRLEDLEHAGAQLEETVHHTIGRVSQLEERATGAEKTLQRQAVDAARANIMAETSLSLMELDLDEKMNVLDTSMQHRIGTEISGVRERLDAERDEQLRSSKALRRLQKLMSRPDAGEIFRSFDTDGDGTINRSELQDGFAKIGEPLDDADMHALMALVDGDGDGNVDYKEFEQMSKMSEKMVEMASAASVARAKLESEISTLQSTAAGMTNAIAVMTATVDGLTSTVDGVTNAVDAVTGTVDGVTSKIDGMMGTIDGMKGAIDDTAGAVSAFDDLPGRLDGMATALDGLTALGEQVQAAEDNISQMNGEIRGRPDAGVDSTAMSNMMSEMDNKLAGQLAEQLAEQRAELSNLIEIKNGGLNDLFKSAIAKEVAVLKDLVGAEISGVRERLDAERDEQLRSSKALRRLQKLMSRPDAGEIFRSFDTDGDGTINRSELQDGFAKIGEPLDDADMHALMALVDGDGDGNVDYKEFEQMSKMSEKMVEMASAASVEREKLMLLVETTREDLTNMLDSKCADVVESTAHSVDQLHSTVDSISGRVEEKVEAEVQEMRAALSGQSLVLKQLRQGIETHTEALDLVQYHVDLVHRQLSEADIANMTESIILRAAQVRHEERSAKVLHAANTALQEVHRHTESLVALQEDVGHDRATHEKAFSALHSQIVHLSACLDDAEVHINLDLALIHAATSRQSEQIFGLQARVDTIQMKAVEGDVQCEWLQEQISTNEMTATQAIEKVQGNVERVYRSLNDAEVNLLAELSIAQAGVSRSFEQISAVRQISAAQTSAVAESCETSRALNKSELASLARVIRASISAVQVTSDHWVPHLLLTAHSFMLSSLPMADCCTVAFHSGPCGPGG